MAINNAYESNSLTNLIKEFIRTLESYLSKLELRSNNDLHQKSSIILFINFWNLFFKKNNFIDFNYKKDQNLNNLEITLTTNDIVILKSYFENNKENTFTLFQWVVFTIFYITINNNIKINKHSYLKDFFLQFNFANNFEFLKITKRIISFMNKDVKKTIIDIYKKNTKDLYSMEILKYFNNFSKEINVICDDIYFEKIVKNWEEEKANYSDFKNLELVVDKNNSKDELKNIPNLFDKTFSEIHQILTGFGFYYIDDVINFSNFSSYKSKKILNIFNFPIVKTKYNFNNLNIDENHPSRMTNQTFFINFDNNDNTLIQSNEELVLRTHTTTMTSLIVSNDYFRDTLYSEDFAFFMFGSCYRKDDIDSTHLPKFHQLDLFWGNKNSNLLQLVEILKKFCIKFFNKPDLKFRIRSSYFPFTTPSLEFDVFIHNKWVEILGSGLLDHNVTKKSNNYYHAAGIGIERLIMTKYNLTDIKQIYNNDY